MSYQHPYPNYGSQGGAGFPGQPGPGYGQQPPPMGFQSMPMGPGPQQHMYGPPLQQVPYATGGAYSQHPVANFPGAPTGGPYGGAAPSYGNQGYYGAPASNAPGYANYPPPGIQSYQPSPGPMGYPNQYCDGSMGGYNHAASSGSYLPGSAHPSSSQGQPAYDNTMNDAQGYFNPYGHQGTVRPVANFDANADAESLYKAMKGFGCNDKAVMNVLCFRSNVQRQQIKQAFQTKYGKDLVKNLVAELKGNFEDVIVALMDTPASYDAKELRGAMKGLGTTESTLIEILATRTNAEINEIKHAYRSHFSRDLGADIQSETSGDFLRMLASMCAASRDESMNVDPDRAKVDAERLYKAGEKRLGTDEAMFNAILASQNFAQLQRVFVEYQRITKRDIEKALANEFSGDILDGWLTVVKCIKNRPQYFAENLYRSMKGMGTNDRLLIRTVVTRCEKDMVQIKQEFQRMYNKSLESFIQGDTSGAYKNALIALVTGK